MTAPAPPPFYFGTNTKMHQTPAETVAFLDALGPPPSTEGGEIVRTFVIPPFTSLADAARAPGRVACWLGAQTCHWADHGAHTGEISPATLAAMGLDLVLVGHAERRTGAGETDAVVRAKVEGALRNGLRVLLCVGDSREEHDAGAGAEACARHLLRALSGLPAEQLDRVLVAYEPVWSIGEGGTPATPDQLARPLALLRAWTRSLTQRDAGLPILYGGSVNPGNVAELATTPEVDGLFVGRAAWTPEGYRDLLTAAFAARARPR